MRAFKLYHSKDILCDYLLAKMWQRYLAENNLDTDSDYDLIDISQMRDFARFIVNDKSKLAKNELASFGFDNPKSLAEYLKQSYHNLYNMDVEF